MLWFNIKNGGNPAPQAMAGDRAQPALSRASTDSHLSADTAHHARDYIFLDSTWLLDCIKLILSHKLVEEISTYEKLMLT